MKYKYNRNFFSKINTKDKAYWLGFMYSDGCNQPKYNKATVLLSVKDIKHLKKLCRSMKINLKCIYIYPPSPTAIIKGRYINAKYSCRLSINSKKVSEDLLKLGVFPQKAETLDFPKESWVPNKLMSHFIRGLFDGDGCITKSMNKNVIHYRILIASSPIFCNKFSKYIKKELNITVGIWNCKKLKIKIASISGNRQVKNFCDWMYNKSKNYLERKYLIYKNLNNLIKNLNKKLKKHHSKYIGITFDKTRNKWMATGRKNKILYNIGRFDSEKKAHKAQQYFYKSNKIKPKYLSKIITKETLLKEK
jgi:hypothetical protein